MSYQVTICIRRSGLEQEVVNYKSAIFALQSGYEAYSAFPMMPFPFGKSFEDVACLSPNGCYSCRDSDLMGLAVYEGHPKWRFYCTDCAVVLLPLVKRLYTLFANKK